MKLFRLALIILNLISCGAIESANVEGMGNSERFGFLSSKTDAELCNAYNYSLLKRNTERQIEQILRQRKIGRCDTRSNIRVIPLDNDELKLWEETKQQKEALAERYQQADEAKQRKESEQREKLLAQKISNEEAEQQRQVAEERKREKAEQQQQVTEEREREKAELHEKVLQQKALTLIRKATLQEKTFIIRAVSDALFDSESARYRDVLLIPNSYACIEVNAKNRFGGYTGFQQMVLKYIENRWYYLVKVESPIHSCFDVIAMLYVKNQ